jgi:hypothetical protein
MSQKKGAKGGNNTKNLDVILSRYNKETERVRALQKAWFLDEGLTLIDEEDDLQ